MTTYQTPNPVRLRLKLEAGRIDVITWDEPRAEVEVTPLGNDQASIEAAENVQQELRGSGEPGASVRRQRRSLFGLRRGPSCAAISSRTAARSTPPPCPPTSPAAAASARRR